MSCVRTAPRNRPPQLRLTRSRAAVAGRTCAPRNHPTQLPHAPTPRDPPTQLPLAAHPRNCPTQPPHATHPRICASRPPHAAPPRELHRSCARSCARRICATHCATHCAAALRICLDAAHGELTRLPVGVSNVPAGVPAVSNSRPPRKNRTRGVHVAAASFRFPREAPGRTPAGGLTSPREEESRARAPQELAARLFGCFKQRGSGSGVLVSLCCRAAATAAACGRC